MKSKIMKKADFQKLQPPQEFSDLFFYSGGSSGDPKISIFTYDDYHRQMELAAEGLYAAGLDPAKDRAMNLFFAGGLYGGFLSFFTILEKLQCPQFPMAAHTDHRFVAETIVRHGVNVLLGMPSYLLQLFRENEELLSSNKVIKKIFYGGEHFTQNQRDYFAHDFGVEVIKSATYGSVDAGPLGFQCLHSTGGVHHLHSRLHDLEIIDLVEDKPVAAGETGRLLFSSKVRKGQQIKRYEIGDIGKWVPGVCTCGRTQPRFELQGRTGDIFRVGGSFLNYEVFARILSSKLNYSGSFQIQIHPGEKKKNDRLIFVLDKNLVPAGLKEKMEPAFLTIKDFKELVTVDHTLDHSIEFRNMDDFEVSKGSGKVPRVVDRRKQ